LRFKTSLLGGSEDAIKWGDAIAARCCGAVESAIYLRRKEAGYLYFP
jgi:hypothetical protein